MSTAPTVRVVPRMDLWPMATVTDILIEHEGRHYASRTNVLLDDTEPERRAQALAFLLRQKRNAQ